MHGPQPSPVNTRSDNRSATCAELMIMAKRDLAALITAVTGAQMLSWGTDREEQ